MKYKDLPALIAFRPACRPSNLNVTANSGHVNLVTAMDFHFLLAMLDEAIAIAPQSESHQVSR